VMIPSIGALPGLLEGSRRTVRKVKENVAWALAYNSVLIPIASGVLPLLLASRVGGAGHVDEQRLRGALEPGPMRETGI